MRGYVSVDSAEKGQIPVESRTEIYRDPGDTERILAETDGERIPLGVADVTVSRKKGSTAPVVIEPRDGKIEVRNNGNSNGVTVVSQGIERDVPEGHVETLDSDATIAIGYQTELQLRAEREAKVEQNVVHRGQGDVVMGDSVDRSTTVGDDNVINRSDIGGDQPADVGDDNVINDSDVGGSGPSGTDSGSGGSQPAGPDSGSAGSNGDTQYCINCGTQVAVTAAFCPSCGQNLGVESGAETGGDTQQFCQRHDLAYSGDVCPECASRR